MESVAILGVAGNVLQCVDFGLKLLSKAKELHKQSSTKENVEIEAIAIHLRETLDRINNYCPPTSSAATKLQRQCVEIINELVVAVDDLKNRGQPNKWKSFRKAIKVVRSKEKIEQWTQRLEAIRNEYGFELEVEILLVALDHRFGSSSDLVAGKRSD